MIKFKLYLNTYHGKLLSLSKNLAAHVLLRDLISSYFLVLLVSVMFGDQIKSIINKTARGL